MQSAPTRSPNSDLARRATLLAMQSRGVLDAIATSPTGDPNFGKRARATKLGGFVGAGNPGTAAMGASLGGAMR